jgi:hypothetical protein
LDRGLDTDFDDLVFLIQNNHVDINEFKHPQCRPASRA